MSLGHISSPVGETQAACASDMVVRDGTRYIMIYWDILPDIAVYCSIQYGIAFYAGLGWRRSAGFAMLCYVQLKDAYWTSLDII